ncbi:MAG: hypothetical protein ABFD07_09970 [Methanobacterium sp.]
MVRWRKYDAQKDKTENIKLQNVDLPTRLTTISEFEVVCNHYLQNNYKMDSKYIDGIWHLNIILILHPDAIGNYHDLYSTDKNKSLNIRFEAMQKYIYEHKILGVVVKYEQN